MSGSLARRTLDLLLLGGFRLESFLTDGAFSVRIEGGIAIGGWLWLVDTRCENLILMGAQMLTSAPF